MRSGEIGGCTLLTVVAAVDGSYVGGVKEVGYFGSRTQAKRKPRAGKEVVESGIPAGISTDFFLVGGIAKATACMSGHQTIVHSSQFSENTRLQTETRGGGGLFAFDANGHSVTCQFDLVFDGGISGTTKKGKALDWPKVSFHF